MSSAVIDVDINSLNNVLSGIQEAPKAPSLQELTKELEIIATKNSATINSLFDLAETAQLDYALCSKVLSLTHQIKSLKSNS